jgi:uncharacterized membrane protein YeaQ/YmgE (transglycosylase-associated protein family)
VKPEIENQVHRIYEIVGFRTGAPYTLEVQFNDGVTRVVDFTDVLQGELYGPLKDPKVFGRVKLDREARNLVWPNGADFDPEILHDWPQRRAAMVAAAARWRRHSRVDEVLHIVWSAILGFVAGFIARVVMHTHLGILSTTLLGIAGAIVGGWIARNLSMRSEAIARHEELYAGYAALLGGFTVPFLIITFFAR